MTLRIIPAIMASVLCLASCRDYNEPQTPPEQDEHIYSFTAVLPEPDSRLGYQDQGGTGDLKMVWDKDDVIWLYPDKSMGDTEERYKFVQNTGAGTSHTVFVHQGYIPNWEHWSGKAIYLFPKGDNFDVEHDSEDFLAKAYVQQKNGDTEHLKYAEHVLGPDGDKRYTEYWANILVDANLKHDHKLTFAHKHTVVYKVMLRGFIFDIPGGSELRMSGDAWANGEETVLTLGSKEDNEPFIKVGEYGKEGYQDNVLTAYIIRQVEGDVDGSIKKGGNLRFDLLTYDKDDGKTYDFAPLDTLRLNNPDYPSDYFTNLPWGDEYTWEVTATADIDYKPGDFVVADLTDTSKDYAYPKVAVDLGLPLKWGAFNVGAKKIDDYGAYFPWGQTTPFYQGGSGLGTIYGSEWASGDTAHDAATKHWGDEWKTPTMNEFLDLVHYARWYDNAGNTPDEDHIRWNCSNLQINDRIMRFKENPARNINGVGMVLVESKFNGKYIYIHIAGNYQGDRSGAHGVDKAYCNMTKTGNTSPLFMGVLDDSQSYYVGPYDNSRTEVQQLATSTRAVKRVRKVKD